MYVKSLATVPWSAASKMGIPFPFKMSLVKKKYAISGLPHGP
uniref:Uncharacterized protein n=1 Tax=Rhizophora mucronata TaxID=61149 RepID=A0A2P2R2W0_RHIMU